MAELEEEWGLVGVVLSSQYDWPIDLCDLGPLMKFDRQTYGKVLLSFKMIAECLQKWRSVWKQVHGQRAPASVPCLG